MPELTGFVASLGSEQSEPRVPCGIFDSFGMGISPGIQSSQTGNLEQQSVSKHQQRPLRVLLPVFPPSMGAGERFL